MIRITSKKAGFRRCGMPHPKQPVEYPDDRFSEEDIEILKAEPMLIVELDLEEPGTAGEDKQEAEADGEAAEDVSEDTTVATPATDEAEVALRGVGPYGPEAVDESAPVVDFNEWTVKQLTVALEDRGIEIPKKARKAELIDLIKTV